jgi:RecA-family ATPase
LSKEKEKPYMTGEEINNLPPIEWVWPGYIPKGHLTLLIGNPGAGKSIFSQDLADRLSKGGEWPDGELINQNETGKTLWIDAEGSVTILASRMIALGMNRQDFILPRLPEIFEDFKLNKDSINQIEKILEETKPKLVVIDSLSGIHEKEEKSSREINEILKPLHSLAANYNCGILLIHHLNKESQQSRSKKKEPINLNRARGSTHIGAVVRSALAIDKAETTVTKEDNENSTVLKVFQVKNNLAEVNRNPLYFTISSNGVTYHSLDGLEFNLKQSDGEVQKAIQIIMNKMNSTEYPIPSKEMTDYLASQGLSESTWKRAKALLPIESEKVGKEWVWKLSKPNS